MSDTIPGCRAEAPIPTGLSNLVSMIGEDEFGDQLLQFLAASCGAEYCTVLHFSQDAASMISIAGPDIAEVGCGQVALYFQNQRWKRDPMIAQARRELDRQPVSIVQTAIRELPEADFRRVLYDQTNVCDRVVLCTRSATGIICVSILRTWTAGIFSSNDLLNLNEACRLLVAIVEKHAKIVSRRQGIFLALTSLDQIEKCLAKASASLTRREAEVCARILYGMSSLGMALELGISEETVTTYRKRMYQRLGIATQRELLLWYVAHLERPWAARGLRAVPSRPLHRVADVTTRRRAAPDYGFPGRTASLALEA